MDNYVKGEVKEVVMPDIFSLDSNDVHMKVGAGSKIRNLMGYAMKKIKEPNTKQICWSGSGKAITKTISCAEIMKRNIRGLHQITEIRKHRVEEYWNPKTESLERLKVNRDIPAISILLSKEPKDKDHPSYQAPGSFEAFWKDVMHKDKSRSSVSQKGKHRTRNILLEGAKETGTDSARSKADNNNDNNRKRKLQNENKGRGRGRNRGKRDVNRPGSSNSNAEVS